MKDDDNVTTLERHFPLDAELAGNLLRERYKYTGAISTTSVLGCLELVKLTIHNNQFIEEDVVGAKLIPMAYRATYNTA